MVRLEADLFHFGQDDYYMGSFLSQRETFLAMLNEKLVTKILCIYTYVSLMATWYKKVICAYMLFLFLPKTKKEITFKRVLSSH